MTGNVMEMGVKYHSGFGNFIESEALEGSLPHGQNSPQKPAHGLFAEQISGSSFLAPRSENLRSWFYRIQPSVLHSAPETVTIPRWESTGTAAMAEADFSYAQLRWDPAPLQKSAVSFIDGLVTYAVSGDLKLQRGVAVHLYSFNDAKPIQVLSNADGHLLFVPENGSLSFRTEFGLLEISPGEIAVIPRGIKFQVGSSGPARGYVAENYGRPFKLPDLGPIGSNGLANPRDFLAPHAAYENKKGDFEGITKFQGRFFRTHWERSPFDVVAWHGNYYPYKYDLSLFQSVNSVSFDHPDPSIFTVLTSPGEVVGTSNIDFVIFPPRWMVAEHTFRPPYFHRNLMSEFMGLIRGQYDSKPQGFLPGGSSLHNMMSAHGPDAQSFTGASEAVLKPEYYKDALAFMFEGICPFQPTPFAMETPLLQKNYLECWQGLKNCVDKKWR